ncbi:MAG: hypothetical protein DWQ34_18005 [Planctomycetota bacterium]|nr:MAG: hypothetical protein DWQ29_19770 [Planctomycetota bacterium]REJ90082.1 MAG: hypothetical protein DWQ34_18005 [Planctomycetota bacterium]REK23467.1 MAG: hypothetical protein DWQ41_17105 [Planctomycetota bacterium]REK38893.1 MAG: hypothetical protein DWQ45_03350 [Planctomycetota bacterium]
MLVATALVMLIMLLFAQVFEAAVGTLTDQRGLSNNDAKARTVTTTLRGDLQKLVFRASPARGAIATVLREFDANGSGSFDPYDPEEDFNQNARLDGISVSPRGIVPLGPGDTPDARQRGFFYISENDPFDDTDDVLHLVVFLEESQRDAVVADSVQTPFFGRAVNLGAGHRNQPDFDDGNVGNGAGISRAAEIVYFMRGDKLHRRVLLLRDPLSSGSPPFSTQPTQGVSGTGGEFTAVFDQPYPGNSFLNDWDYSGTRVWNNDANSNGMIDDETTDGFSFRFHGLDSLDNTLGLGNRPIAFPVNRYGFYFRSGRPLEFALDGSGNPTAFLGRYTHEETSHANFLWPGFDAPAAQHPMQRTDLTLNVDRTVSQYAGGARAGEDILLTGAEAFNIEVWDAGYHEDVNNNGTIDSGEDRNGNGVLDDGAWVNLGNGTGLGLFTQSGVGGLNTSWGNRNPGYGPLPSGGNRVFDTWHPVSGNAPPFSPLQVSPTTTGGAPNPNVVTWAATTPATPGLVLFPDAGLSPPNFSYGYIVVNGGTSGGKEPEWPREPGAIVRDGDVVWQCFDNRIGLEQIRITVRFRDPGSDQHRQVTLIHSFVE